MLLFGVAGQVGNRAAESEVVVIVAKILLTTSSDATTKLGFPAFSSSHALLGFYRESAASAAEPFGRAATPELVFVPLTSAQVTCPAILSRRAVLRVLTFSSARSHKCVRVCGCFVCWRVPCWFLCVFPWALVTAQAAGQLSASTVQGAAESLGREMSRGSTSVFDLKNFLTGTPPESKSWSAAQMKSWKIDEMKVRVLFASRGNE